ncbi:MAG: hypothetical protein ABIG89_03905 [Candidatus Woesearchaeota archaeon]
MTTIIYIAVIRIFVRQLVFSDNSDWIDIIDCIELKICFQMQMYFVKEESMPNNNDIKD